MTFHPGDTVEPIDRVPEPCARVVDHLGPNLMDVYDPLAYFVGGGSWPVSKLQPAVT